MPAPLANERINAMNEKTIDQFEDEVLSYEVSDEALESAGATEIAGAWTVVCTGIQCPG
jgi:recombinational DNA repair protein RecT